MECTGVIVDNTGVMVDNTGVMVDSTGVMVDSTGVMVDNYAYNLRCLRQNPSRWTPDSQTTMKRHSRYCLCVLFGQNDVNFNGTHGSDGGQLRE